MNGKGWHKDNYRHSLAARGILSTRYYAQKIRYRYRPPREPPVDVSKSAAQPEVLKELLGGGVTPRTARSHLKAAAGLQQETAGLVAGGRDVAQAIYLIQTGNYSEQLNPSDPESPSPIQLLEDRRKYGLNDDDIEALQSAINVRALSLVNTGQPVPPSLEKHLSSDMKQRLKYAELGVKRLEETPFRKALREQLEGATIGTAAGIAEAPGEGIAMGAEEFRKLGERGKEFKGTVGQIDAAKDSPLLRTNTAITNPEDNGILNPLSFVEGGVPNLGSSWSFLGPTPNVALASTPTKILAATKKVQDQIDSLYEARKDYAKVDYGIYEAGNKAFKQGNREKLINSISEIEAEENKLKDRWTLVGQTHRDLLSMQNFMSSFAKDTDNPALELRKEGAERLADQTEKLARVRAELLKSMNATYVRRVLLQGRLKRLDSNVLPESGAPVRVQRLLPPEKSFIMDVKNPVLRERDNV